MQNEKKIFRYNLDGNPVLKYKDWVFTFASGWNDQIYNGSVYHYMLEIVPPDNIIELLNETYANSQINSAISELQQIEDYCSSNEDVKMEMLAEYLSDSIITEDTVATRKGLLKKLAREITYFEELFPFLVFEVTGCMFNTITFDVFYDEMYALPGSVDPICYYELTADMSVSIMNSYNSLMSGMRSFNMPVIFSEYTNTTLSNKRYRMHTNIYDLCSPDRSDKVVNYCAIITVLGYKLPDDMTSYKDDVIKLVYGVYGNIIHSNYNLECFIRLHHLLNKNIFGFSAYYNYDGGTTTFMLLIKPFKIGETVFDVISLSAIKFHKEFPNDLVDENGALINISDSYNYNELLWAFFAKEKSILYFLNASENVNFTRSNRTGSDIISVFGMAGAFGTIPITDSPAPVNPIEKIGVWDNFILFKIVPFTQLSRYESMYNKYFVLVNPSYIEDELEDFEINSSDVRDLVAVGLNDETDVLNEVGISDVNDIFNGDAAIRFLCVYDEWYAFSIFSLKVSNKTNFMPPESSMSSCLRELLRRNKSDSNDSDKHQFDMGDSDYDF